MTVCCYCHRSATPIALNAQRPACRVHHCPRSTRVSWYYNVPSCGPLHDSAVTLRQPVGVDTTSLVATGAWLEPVAMLLAAIAAEHAVAPLNQSLVPIEAGGSMLDLSMQDPRHATHCIQDLRTLHTLRGDPAVQVEGAHDVNRAIVPVYILM